MIAYETLHEAARQVLDTGATSGVRRVNGSAYRWEMGQQLCVHYEDFRSQPRSVCLE